MDTPISMISSLNPYYCSYYYYTEYDYRHCPRVLDKKTTIEMCMQQQQQQLQLLLLLLLLSLHQMSATPRQKSFHMCRFDKTVSSATTTTTTTITAPSIHDPYTKKLKFGQEDIYSANQFYDYYYYNFHYNYNTKFLKLLHTSIYLLAR